MSSDEEILALLKSSIVQGYGQDISVILDMDGTLIDREMNPRPFLKPFLRFLFSNFKQVGIWTAANELWFSEAYQTVLKPALIEISDNKENPATANRQFDFHQVLLGDRATVIYPVRSAFTLYDGNDGISSDVKVFKRLRKLWNKKKYGYMTRHNTLIIDDTKETYYYNHGNAIGIETFNGSNMDRGLIDIVIFFLSTLLPSYRKQGDELSSFLGLNPSIIDIIHEYSPIKTIRNIDRGYSITKQ